MILVKGINLSKKKNKSQNILANNKYFYKTYSVNKKTMFYFKNINNFQKFKITNTTLIDSYV